MKKIILFSIILFAIFGCITETGESTKYIFTVKNESGKFIKIKSYLSQFPDVLPIITNLEDGQQLTKKFNGGLPPQLYTFNDFFGDSQLRDSIIVIYNNEKMESFTVSCSNDRNPLNFCIYSKPIETFTFIEQDYQNAVYCNGDCE